MLVGWKMTEDEDVDVVCGRLGLKVLDKLCGKMSEQLSVPYLFYPSSFLVSRHPWFREADIIQLYNIHGGYFSHTVLPLITRNRPVVWRLSDMWPMTGHCSYSYDCEAWRSGCDACPHLDEYPFLSRDTTHLLWCIKKRLYKNSLLTIVAPSRWIAKLAEESPLLGRFPIHWIPNGVDTAVFRPIPKKHARAVLGIPTNQKAILFSGQLLQERRKGYSFLMRALEKLAKVELESIVLLVAGGRGRSLDTTRRFRVKYLGDLFNNDLMMAISYSAADMFVLPTLADNFPNTILESMACGTPVVSFDVGGISEALTHMETGYVATPEDPDDLARGIQILLDDSVRHEMGHRCREVVEEMYSLQREIDDFSRLYNELRSQKMST